MDSLDCAMNDNKTMPFHYLRLVVSLFFGFSYLGIFTLGYLIFIAIKKYKFRPYIIITSGVFLVIFL